MQDYYFRYANKTQLIYLILNVDLNIYFANSE